MSATSRWQVSPARPSVGSPDPAAAAVVPPGNGGSCGSRPSGLPGRSSVDACSPTSARRSSAYPALSSASSGTSANSGSPYHASRSAKASLAHSMKVWAYSPGRHGGEVEAGQQRELLEHHRPLPPGSGLADRVAVELARDRGLERRLPAGHVVRAQQPVLGLEERVDRLRHPAAIEGVARGVDARLARRRRPTARAARRRRPAAGCGAAAPARARAGRSRPSSATPRGTAARRRGSRPRSPAPPGSRRARSRSPGASTSASSQVPKSRSSRHQASNAPGTTAASGPTPGTSSSPRAV